MQGQTVDGSMVTEKWSSHQGFAKWEFPDGSSWISEVPVLMLPSNSALAKPAGSSSSASSAQKKLEHSRVYHKALVAFKQKCKQDSVPYNHEKAKAAARLAVKSI